MATTTISGLLMMTGLGATDIPIDTITEVMDAGGWYKVGRWSIPEALPRPTD